LEEVFGRITVLLLWAQTREKETFTALEKPGLYTQGKQRWTSNPLKCSERLGKHTHG